MLGSLCVQCFPSHKLASSHTCQKPGCNHVTTTITSYGTSPTINTIISAPTVMSMHLSCVMYAAYNSATYIHTYIHTWLVLKQIVCQFYFHYFTYTVGYWPYSKTDKYTVCLNQQTYCYASVYQCPFMPKMV